MSITLAPELERELSSEAERCGMSLPDYVQRLLLSARDAVGRLETGADLVAYWRANQLIGTRTEIEDSAAHARAIRDQAQRRIRD
jgi:hypothetical protein